MFTISLFVWMPPTYYSSLWSTKLNNFLLSHCPQFSPFYLNIKRQSCNLETIINLGVNQKHQLSVSPFWTTMNLGVSRLLYFNLYAVIKFSFWLFRIVFLIQQFKNITILFFHCILANCRFYF